MVAGEDRRLKELKLKQYQPAELGPGILGLSFPREGIVEAAQRMRGPGP